MALNCAALTETLLESRLFGHRRGAFTGADRDVAGVFEEADGGTLFLDEIGDIAPATQMALLRALQQGEIQPLGGEVKRVNVRVVAASHADLEERCQQGRFRQDLYFRLAVAELELPPLHDYPVAEREQLLNYFLVRQQAVHQRPAPLVLAPATRQQLLTYAWPGNVRELENVVQALYVFADPTRPVPPADLPRRLHRPISSAAADNFPAPLAVAMATYVARTVAHCNGVKRQAAHLLDIDERVVTKYLKQHEGQAGTD